MKLFKTGGVTLISEAHARWHASLARQWVARLTAQTWTEGQHNMAPHSTTDLILSTTNVLILLTTLSITRWIHEVLRFWSSAVYRLKISICFSHLEGFYITSISYRFISPSSTHAPALTSHCLFLIGIYMISSCNTCLFLPHESIWFMNVYFKDMKNNRYMF